jgi:hypothetical protein
LRFCLSDLVIIKAVPARTCTASLLKLHNSSLIRSQHISSPKHVSASSAFIDWSYKRAERQNAYFRIRDGNLGFQHSSKPYLSRWLIGSGRSRGPCPSTDAELELAFSRLAQENPAAAFAAQLRSLVRRGAPPS